MGMGVLTALGAIVLVAYLIGMAMRIRCPHCGSFKTEVVDGAFGVSLCSDCHRKFIV